MSRPSVAVPVAAAAAPLPLHLLLLHVAAAGIHADFQQHHVQRQSGCSLQQSLEHQQYQHQQKHQAQQAMLQLTLAQDHPQLAASTADALSAASGLAVPTAD